MNNLHATDYSERMAKHILAERSAQVGYPYPGRQAENDWMTANLPSDQQEFLQLKAAVRDLGWHVIDIDLAAILLRTCVFASHVSGELTLCNHDHPELAEIWLRPQEAQKSPRSCRWCGAPAVSYSDFGGWTCAYHYDEFS